MEILTKLENLSKKLNLEFNKNWFDFVWITKEQGVLTCSLSDCHEDTFEKYGHTILQRLENLEKFYNSEDYQNLIKLSGGQVISKNSIHYYKKFIEMIDNKKIKNLLFDFCNRINKKNGLEEIAVLTETEDESKKENLLNRILVHEWIHILIEQNNLRPKNWKYNEGLATYIEYFITGKLNDLEVQEEMMDCDFYKEYFRKAIIFRDLVKNVPDKRKIDEIRNFLKERI